MEKLTDPKVWTPLVGSAALVAAYFGFDLPETLQETIVKQFTGVAAAVGALGGTIWAVWNSRA